MSELNPLDSLMRIPASLFDSPLIYCLVRDGKVMYVGQTKKGLSRPMAHLGKKAFDAIYVQPCQEDELNYLESKAIRRYAPPYNMVPGFRNRPLDTVAFAIINELFPTYVDSIEKFKHVLGALGITPFEFKGRKYIDDDDIDKVTAALLDVVEAEYELSVLMMNNITDGLMQDSSEDEFDNANTRLTDAMARVGIARE